VNAKRHRDPAALGPEPGTRDIGSAMEQLAEAFLKTQNLRPVARNHRCRHGEIDLVMRDGETLVFVEVRYRRSDRFGTAAETIDPRKQRRLAAAASHYLQGHPTLLPCRFDVVAVSGDEPIQWIKNAFLVEI
jgi:putative endonuclease